MEKQNVKISSVTRIVCIILSILGVILYINGVFLLVAYSMKLNMLSMIFGLSAFTVGFAVNMITENSKKQFWSTILGLFGAVIIVATVFM